MRILLRCENFPIGQVVRSGRNCCEFRSWLVDDKRCVGIDASYRPLRAIFRRDFGPGNGPNPPFPFLRAQKNERRHDACGSRSRLHGRMAIRWTNPRWRPLIPTLMTAHTCVGRIKEHSDADPAIVLPRRRIIVRSRFCISRDSAYFAFPATLRSLSRGPYV